MRQHGATEAREARRTDRHTPDSVHPRHDESVDDADAWPDDTGPAMRLVAVWKHAIERNEHDVLRLGVACMAFDLLAGLSACFAPILTSLFGLARLAALVIFAPSLLRLLAIRHADRPDAELLKAIAIAIGVGAVYFAVRTYLVVEVCKL
jgi:hypothetical protein